MAMGVPHLAWRGGAVPDVTAMPSCDIEIATDNAFTRVVDADRIAAVISRYVPDKELTPGDYWWHIAVVDAAGKRGSWSRVRKFSIRSPEHVVSIPKNATFAEIQAAIARAATQSPATVMFEKGDYRLDPAGAKTFIDLTNAANLVIDGNGAVITFTGFLSFIHLEHSQHVMVKNITFDFDPLPYTAGRVLAVDGKAGTFDVEIAPGHPLLESNAAFERDKKGMIVDPKYPRIKKGVDLVFEHSGWQMLAERQYRFTAAKPDKLSEMAPGDIYVLDPRIAGGFHFGDCNEVVFMNVTTYAISNLGYSSLYSNRLSFLHCGIRLKPGRFIAVNNGGHNHHNARIGPWIEGCTWENTADDICHINCLAMGVEEKLAADRVRLPLHNPYDDVGAGIALDIQVGDLLQFFDRGEGRLVSERKVVSVSKQGKSLEVTLDGDVGDIVTGRPAVKRVAGKKMPAGDGATQVFNASRTCNQFVFRNNTVLNGRRVGVLAKGTGGLIEKNTFDGLGGGAVEFWNAPFEGLAAVDYVVQNNRIRDCGQVDREDAAIWATIFKSGGERLHRNLLIKDNEIDGFSGPAILLRDVQNGLVRGNVVVPVATGAHDTNSIVLLNTEAVKVENNTIKPPTR